MAIRNFNNWKSVIAISGALLLPSLVDCSGSTCKITEQKANESALAIFGKMPENAKIWVNGELYYSAGKCDATPLHAEQLSDSLCKDGTSRSSEYCKINGKAVGLPEKPVDAALFFPLPKNDEVAVKIEGQSACDQPVVTTFASDHVALHQTLRREDNYDVGEGTVLTSCHLDTLGKLGEIQLP